MKKLIVMFISVLLILFFFIKVTVSSNYKYDNSIIEDIKENYELDSNIIYLNKFANYYIVKTSSQVLVLDNMYNLIFQDDVLNLFSCDYDMVYRINKLMYVSSNVKGSSVIYNFYDVYTFDKIDEIILEG